MPNNPARTCASNVPTESRVSTKPCTSSDTDGRHAPPPPPKPVPPPRGAALCADTDTNTWGENTTRPALVLSSNGAVRRCRRLASVAMYTSKRTMPEAASTVNTEALRSTANATR